MADPSPSPPHTDDSPSNCSYRSFSPDYRPPKSPTPTASNHFSVHNTSQPPSEELYVEKTEKNCQEIVKTNDVSRLIEHHEAPKEVQANSKFRNPPETSSPFYHTDASASGTTIAYTVSNAKKSAGSSTNGAKHQMVSATTVPISPPPPPPPPKTSPPSLKWKNSGQPPLPPALPLQIHVGKDGCPLPRLKPLHWDKVRAAPNRSMVWNDIRSNSFKFE
jgi:hypothetical protein